MASRSSLLPWIVAFKALKTALLTTLGIGLLFSIHRDPIDLVLRIAQAVHLPLTSGLFDRALSLAFRATPKKEISLAVTARDPHTQYRGRDLRIPAEGCVRVTVVPLPSE